jgi:hypothetical protein
MKRFVRNVQLSLCALMMLLGCACGIFLLVLRYKGFPGSIVGDIPMIVLVATTAWFYALAVRLTRS